MNRGDVWWAELPEVGRRPACVLTRDSAIDVLNAVTVVPATRTVRGIPTEVPLGPADGLPAECALTLDTLFTIPKALLTSRITTLRGDVLAQVCVALAAATDCRSMS